METRRIHDIQDTERVFKKVVYPGLETLKVLDRNGVPQNNYPGAPVNSFRSKSFILSPRGVPMKTTNHVYSGCHSHPTRVSDLVDNGHGPENYNGTDQPQITGTNSAKIPRKRNETMIQQQKRAATSLSQSNSHHFSNGTSSGHFLTGEPSERRVLQSANSNYFNLSNQGLRLQREWTSLSNSRSMKRASNIVNHRVDRMYFMSGNSIQLKPRYDVDEEELRRMKEQQAKNKQGGHKRGSRTSSRNSVKGNNQQKEPINIQKKLQADSEATGDATTNSEVTVKKPDGTVSPIQGWDAQDKAVTEENVIIRQKSLHEGANGDTGDIDENMRADGRIDGYSINKTVDNSEDNKNEVGEQETTEDVDEVKGQENEKETDEVKVEESKEDVDKLEEETNLDENVAQDNT